MNFARITLIVTAFAFLSVGLSACGFKPMHAPNSFGVSGINYNDISVRTVKNDKVGFLLKQALRDRIGENTKTRYILSLEPTIGQTGLGRGTEDIASRYDLTINTEFELIDTQSGKIVYTDKVSATSTYGAPLDPYGKIAAENNATEQLAVEAADRLLIRLARFNLGK